MKEFVYTITDPQGVHARPAGLFVKEAAKFPCSVSVDKDGNAVDGKRLLALMGLGIKQGQEITLRCEGEQEAEAMEALSDFLQKNL